MGSAAKTGAVVGAVQVLGAMVSLLGKNMHTLHILSVWL